jgi:hypothetical protein
VGATVGIPERGGYTPSVLLLPPLLLPSRTEQDSRRTRGLKSACQTGAFSAISGKQPDPAVAASNLSASLRQGVQGGCEERLVTPSAVTHLLRTASVVAALLTSATFGVTRRDALRAHLLGMARRNLVVGVRHGEDGLRHPPRGNHGPWA